MFLKEETYKGINELLTLTFQGNSHADNCAYWLDSKYLLETAKEFHEKYAHQFPVWADEISNFLRDMGARPTRGALEANEREYEDIGEMFTDVKEFFMSYREKVKAIAEIAEIQEDIEAKSFLDNHLVKLIPYLRQVNIWENKANLIKNDVIGFDDNFEDFTNI